jgi:SAM-dependent methyltransferase
VYSDIDTSAAVDLFCDAHELPFVDQVFHGVIATAVLEHVLYPERVVAEIYRVLVEGGLVYSEIPFMQQVHEGAYDFTRYTLSGHRRLFNQFQEVASGLIAGPATAMVWTIENLALCFAPHHILQLCIKTGVRFLFFWLKYLDYLLKDVPQAMDSASATYFLGSKNPPLKTSDKAIIDRYIGAKRPDHL